MNLFPTGFLRLPFRRFAAGLLVCLLPGSGLGKPVGPGEDFTAVLAAHAKRYPLMNLQDCYKLVVQSCLGSEHAVTDAAGATAWLERELQTMGPGPDEPLVDPITADGSIVRVHLRPFVAQGGKPEQLVLAFVNTAANFHGSREAIAITWAMVVTLAAKGALPFKAGEARDYGAKMAAAGWPAVRHSVEFNGHYRPAYRVIAREQLKDLLPDRR